MRFKGTPGLHVFDSKTGTEIGQFDSKGYLTIEDEKLLTRVREIRHAVTLV